MVDGPQNNLRVGIVIQARMQSTRLPGKVLRSLPIGSGKPLLKCITDEIINWPMLGKVVVATSLNSENDSIEKFCNSERITCFRGSEEDVLSRFWKVIEVEKFDVIVRLTSDNPFLDVALLEKTIEYHLVEKTDYTKTVGLPLGMNFEIVSAQALCGLKSKTLETEDLEHVTLFLQKNDEYKKSIFRPILEDLGHLRLTVDYPSDFLIASQLFSLLRDGERPGIKFIKRIFNTDPWIFEINRTNEQKRF